MAGTDAFVLERGNEIERSRGRSKELGFECDLGFCCLGFEEIGVRLGGGDAKRDADEGGKRVCEVAINTPPFLVCTPQQKLVVGYALTSKKKKSFLQPKFEALARLKGIRLVSIDQNRPLSEQGPFDVVLHKLSGKLWQDNIQDYQHIHPEVTILDPPGAIQQLHNRHSMLQDVADLNLSDCDGTVGVPRQMVVMKDPSSLCDAVATAGLKFPLVAKPLVVDGTAKSHQLSLAYDRFSLRELEPPLVLQEFVNHGGVLFKIFVVGEAIKVVKRFSLPNVTDREKAKVAGVFQFPRVSCAAATLEDANLDPWLAAEPPRSLLERLVKQLRRRLGLQLFNLDMIREHGSRDVFYVIDINYFPGYSKLQDYEHLFTDFLLSLAHNKQKKGPGT